MPRVTSEKSLINDFLIQASHAGARMFRNVTAMAWAGRVEVFKKMEFVRVMAGDALVRAARPIHAGLCVGSSDCIGWTPVIVTVDMVGSTIAIFTAVEFKTGSVPTTPEQVAFLKSVVESGGRAGVAHSSCDGMEIVKAAGCL